MIKRTLAVLMFMAIAYGAFFWITPQFMTAPIPSHAPLSQEDIAYMDKELERLSGVMKDNNSTIKW